MTAPEVLVQRAAELGAETWRVSKELPALVAGEDRADDRRMVVARLLFWRWMAGTGRVGT